MSTIIGSFPFTGGVVAYSSRADAVPVTEPVTVGDPLPREYVCAALNQNTYGKAPPPNVATFWKMRFYPTCRIAFAVAAGPIFAGMRTAAIRNADDNAKPATPTGTGAQVIESAEDKRRKLVEDVFQDQWCDVLCGLECLNFGRWTQEVIWGRTKGVTAPIRFKSFLPWEIELQRDGYNDFAGFKHEQQVRDARYAFHAVNDPHLDPIFGVPRAEAAREAWYRATCSAESGDKIERKASGIQMRLQFPSGATWKDTDGNPVLTKTVIQTIVNAAASGASWTEPIPWSKEDVKSAPELLKYPLITAQPFDWGDNGPALLASIARLDRLDKDIFRAWHRPEREAMEGDHGTKAEAGVHGQVGIVDSEKVHSDFLRQFNKQVLDRFLVTNFGPDAAGTIYFKPTPLVDAQQQFKQQVVTAMLASTTEGPQAAANLDKRELMKQTELPLVAEDQVPEVAPMPQMSMTDPYNNAA